MFSPPVLLCQIRSVFVKPFEINCGYVPENVDPLTPRRSRSLTVVETDTDRSVTYEFLLVFHSNY